MKNICRPFVLYNDFLPPGVNSHSDIQYLAFGYYDGLSVGGNIYDSDAEPKQKDMDFLEKYGIMRLQN